MNKYAIVKKGNHQYFLEEGAVLEIPHVKIPEGQDFEFTEVLAMGDDKDFILGTPIIEGAKVIVFVKKHVKGPKEYGFKYKAKSRYRKRWGYRRIFTRILVKQVVMPGEKVAVSKKTTKTQTKAASADKAKKSTKKAESSTKTKATKTAKTVKATTKKDKSKAKAKKSE